MDLPNMALVNFSSGIAASGSLALFFAFLIGHALADFPLQGEYLAIGKERGDGLEKLTGSVPLPGMWLYCLFMHALIHGGAVWFVSGSAVLGMVEVCLHGLIDFAKSSRWTNFYFDQSLHITCKLAYVYLISQGVVASS